MLEEEKKVKEDLQSKYEYVWFLSCFSLWFKNICCTLTSSNNCKTCRITKCVYY